MGVPVNSGVTPIACQSGRRSRGRRELHQREELGGHCRVGLPVLTISAKHQPAVPAYISDCLRFAALTLVDEQPVPPNSGMSIHSPPIMSHPPAY